MYRTIPLMSYKAILNVQRVSQVKIQNQKPCVLLPRRNLVRPRTSWSDLSVNTMRRVPSQLTIYVTDESSDFVEVIDFALNYIIFEINFTVAILKY